MVSSRSGNLRSDSAISECMDSEELPQATILSAIPLGKTVKWAPDAELSGDGSWVALISEV
jgi:hypothetical protein